MRHVTLALALLLAGCSGDSAPFQPGQWEFKFETTAEGKRVFWGGGGQCFAEKDTAGLPARILSNSPFGECASIGSSYAGGKFSVNATCDGKAAATTMPAREVSLRGSYTTTSFEGRLSTQLDGETPVKDMSGTLTARRTGDCPGPQQGNAS